MATSIGPIRDTPTCVQKRRELLCNGCSELTTIRMPLCLKIGRHFAGGCGNLRVYLPRCTHIKTIYSGVHGTCSILYLGADMSVSILHLNVKI